MEATKIDGDYIESLLDRLVNQYNMNWELLSNLFGVDKNKLQNYKKYDQELFGDFYNWTTWTSKALMFDLVSASSPDLRYKMYLELLVDGYKFPIQSIAKLANIDEEYIIDFLNDESNIPIEIRYKLGSCITQLMVILKNTQPGY